MTIPVYRQVFGRGSPDVYLCGCGEVVGSVGWNHPRACMLFRDAAALPTDAQMRPQWVTR